jgi:conjugal transfer pilus assembly protein TraU
VLRKRSLISVFILLIPVLFSHIINAQDAPEVQKCESSFPDLTGDICWSCMFPMRIGGNTIMKVGDIPDNVEFTANNDYNPNDYSCSCKDSNNKDRYGIYISFWEPARVLEVVQKPNCFPTAFGMNMGNDLNMFGAFGNKGQGPTAGEKKFYNVHFYIFPLLEIMDMIAGMDFCTDYMSDFDLAYFTETDPLWNDDELTAVSVPEAAIFANPVAQALCTVDCMASSLEYPLNTLFWCAGCWGSMYPFTGNSGVVGSPVRSTSLLATRLLARLTRIPVPPAIEYDTSSAGAKCGGEFIPVIKKSQYRLSTIFPIPETTGRCCHPIGSSQLIWGDNRNVPATGEYQTYLLWRKRNCCLKIY